MSAAAALWASNSARWASNSARSFAAAARSSAAVAVSSGLGTNSPWEVKYLNKPSCTPKYKPNCSLHKYHYSL